MSNENSKNEILALLAAAGPGSAVKALLTLKNISQTELSLKLGITPSEISRVISGKRKTPRIRKAIAAELDIPVEALFDPMDHKPKERSDAANSPTAPTHDQPVNLFKAAALGQT